MTGSGSPCAAQSRRRRRQDCPVRRGQVAEGRAPGRGGECRDISLNLIGIPARSRPDVPPCRDTDSFAPRKPLKQNRPESQTVEDAANSTSSTSSPISQREMFLAIARRFRDLRSQEIRPTSVGPVGELAEWLRSGLQIRVHRFDSGTRLQSLSRSNGNIPN